MSEQSDPLPRYALTVRLRRVQAAKCVYDQIQQVLYEAEESDLSTYNLQLNGVLFVAVVGEPPPADLHERLRQILTIGTAETLPEEVLVMLQRRREQEQRKGPWVEHHYRPGKRLT